MAVGKKITDLTASGSLKDTDLAIVHDGNGTKRSTLAQLSEYLGTKFSNPNLLINPDFKINQRGSATYTESQGNKKYTVDRWAILKATATKNSDGTFTVSTDKDDGYLTQPLETRLTEDYVITCNVSSVTGNVYLGGGKGLLLKPGINIYHVSPIQEVAIYLKPNSSVKLKWAKLEKGSIATPFVAPNPADELAKCRRFYELINMDTRHATLIGNKVYVTVDVVPKRITPTCKHPGNFKVIISNSMELPLTFNSATAIGGSVLQSFDVSSSTQGDGFCKDFKCTMDAEIY